MSKDLANGSFSSSPKPPKRWPRNIVWAVVIASLFALHILFCVFQVCPYWSICFPLTPIAPYLWPIVAIMQAIWLLLWAVDSRTRRRGRVARFLLAFLLLCFAVDTLTDGDYRWFEIGMRRELANDGGAAAIQAWAQNILASPAQITNLDANETVDVKSLPLSMQKFAAEFHPMYCPTTMGGPWFIFETGGWDMGWGIIVGKRDMAPPDMVVRTNPRRSAWTKQLQPGVYLFAF